MEMRISLLFGIVAIAGRTALRTSVSGLAESESKFQYATSSQIAATHVLPRTPLKSPRRDLDRDAVVQLDLVASPRGDHLRERGDVLQDPFHVDEHHARLIPVSRQDQNHADLTGRQVGFKIVKTADEDADQHTDPRLAAPPTNDAGSFVESARRGIGPVRTPAVNLDLALVHRQAE